jgi:myo-inositol 2-dehydrogenase / D-chiro-inositol 1-dehydrogenase
MAERVGVAVFGLGRAGMIHFQNLFHNHEVSIHYLVESDLEKAKRIASTYHLQATKCLHSDDMETALSDQSVKAVIVCAPTFEHEKIVRSALTHNKAVFCEKPVSQNDDGIKVLYDLADKVKKPLFCSFNRRFDPSLSAMRDRCRSTGEVGSIQMVKTCSRDSPLPSNDYLRISGGMYHDCAVHDIDICCWMLDEFPIEVFSMATAHIEDIRKLDDVDTVLISMRFPSGTLATIDLSRFAAYGYDQRVEVFGSKGMLISENQRPTELTSHLKTGTSQDCIKFSFPQRYADSYVLAMKHFLNVVQGKEEMSVKSTDAINVSLIASACETSHRTGKPVQLNLGK